MNRKEMNAERCRWKNDIGVYTRVDGREKEGVAGCIEEHKDG